jgi:hypothetical protein
MSDSTISALERAGKSGKVETLLRPFAILGVWRLSSEPRAGRGGPRSPLAHVPAQCRSRRLSTALPACLAHGTALNPPRSRRTGSPDHIFAPYRTKPRCDLWSTCLDLPAATGSHATGRNRERPCDRHTTFGRSGHLAPQMSFTFAAYLRGAVGRQYIAVSCTEHFQPVGTYVPVGLVRGMTRVSLKSA